MAVEYTDHPEWGDQVLRNRDDSVKHPMEINLFMAWLLGAICFVGLPLNFEIIIRILYDRTMQLKPRYIIQLGVAFSDVFILSAIVIVVLHFCFGPNEMICHIFVSFFMGISYNCFLLNHFLSLIDCFVAIVFPLWHLVNVTPRRVVNGLIGLNLAMALAMEWPFVSGMLEVRCALQATHGIIIDGTSCVTFILCLVFCCIDFAITWFHLPRSSRAIDVPSANPTAVIQMELQELNIPSIIVTASSPDEAPAATENIDTITQKENDELIPTAGRRRLSVIIEETDDEVAAAVARSTGSGMAIHSSRVTLSRLEWKAIRSFLFGFAPLFLIPLPLFIIYYSFHFGCEQQINDSSSDRQQQLEECQDLTWLITCLFFLFLSLHALVNPITSLWLNNDLKSPSPIRRLRLSLIVL